MSTKGQSPNRPTFETTGRRNGTNAGVDAHSWGSQLRNSGCARRKDVGPKKYSRQLRLPRVACTAFALVLSCRPGAATRMDNTQNLWKRASNLRKRSAHTGVVCSRTTLEKYHEEAYCYSHDRHADCRADLRPVRECGARVAVELLVRW